MIRIDPKAGEHFIGIADKDIEVTNHAIERARQRFNIPHKQAEKWIRDNLRKAQYLGITEEEGGNKARLFGWNRIAIVVDLTETKVVTVYEKTKSTASVRDAVTAAIQTELAKMERAIERKETQVERTKADLYSEIGELMKQRQRTRSQSKKLALTAFINALHEHFNVLDGDIAEVQREQSKLRKGLVAYV